MTDRAGADQRSFKIVMHAMTAAVAPSAVRGIVPHAERLGETLWMQIEMLAVHTGDVEAVWDLTARCASFVQDQGDGLLNVFVPHATAGIAILETGAGSDEDLLSALRELLPADDRWLHRHGSPGHGRSHVLPALIPPYATVPVMGGRLALGTWQSICLVDLNIDNEDRQVQLAFIAG